MGHAGEIPCYFEGELLKLKGAPDHLEKVAKGPFKHRNHVKAPTTSVDILLSGKGQPYRVVVHFTILCFTVLY